MKHLFADVYPGRHEQFSEAFDPSWDYEVYHTHSVVGTKRILNCMDYFFSVWLDWNYDFPAPSNEEKSIRTGLEIIEFMKSLPSRQHPKYVIVHTWHIEGADRMMPALIPLRTTIIRWAFNQFSLKPLLSRFQRESELEETFNHGASPSFQFQAHTRGEILRASGSDQRG